MCIEELSLNDPFHLISGPLLRGLALTGTFSDQLLRPPPAVLLFAVTQMVTFPCCSGRKPRFGWGLPVQSCYIPGMQGVHVFPRDVAFAWKDLVQNTRRLSTLIPQLRAISTASGVT